LSAEELGLASELKGTWGSEGIVGLRKRPVFVEISGTLSMFAEKSMPVIAD
jgi:hypothetical protein